MSSTTNEVAFEEREWPVWVPLASLAVALAITGAAVIQRHALVPPGWPALYALIAVLPCLLDGIDQVTPFRVALPLWIFPVPVLVGVALLHPTSNDVSPFMLVFLTAEVVTRSERGQLIGLGTTIGSMAVVVNAYRAELVHGAAIWILAILFGAFGGFLVQVLDRKARALRDAQAGLSEKAAAEERSRIAREVHDVIAHSLSVTMLHVTAARMALQRGPEFAPQALEAMHEAEKQGRRSLGDIRRTVGLLGPDGNVAAPPMPTAMDLPALVSEFNSAGLDVRLDINGAVGAIDSAAGLNLYRIVQESLTNVAKHAPGASARVELNVSQDDMKLLVHNSATNGSETVRGDGSGLGVRGMIERATLLDGTLAAGPDGDGWSVLLVAPRAAAPA